MKFVTLLTGCILLIGCSKPAGSLFSGRVAYVYFLDTNNSVTGYTRFDKGLPGTGTSVHEDPWVDVYPEWVIVRLMNRKDHTEIVPRDRVRSIIVGTREDNELNIPHS